MPTVSCTDCGREFQSEESMQQHKESKHAKAKQKPKSASPKLSPMKIGALVVIIAIVGIGLYFLLSPPTPSGPGKLDDFAKCLTQKGAVMYGAYWCPHCIKQKEDFGNSFQFVNYVECDAGGPNPQPALCTQKGVTGYPTWIFNGESRSGEQSLQSLGDWAQCKLPT